MRRLLPLIFGLFFKTVVSFAQVSSAELSGTVSDPTGAVVANAKIVALKADTGTVRETMTGPSGNYLFTVLQPGTYDVTIEATGFQKQVQKGITLQVNQRASVDFRLQVGDVTESVEVAATAPLLESQSSSLGNVIDEKRVAELPLNGRNFVQLAILSPGVNGTGFSTSGTIMSGTRPDDRRPGTEIFANGNREGSNNFLYDGIDNNERLTLSIVLRPGVEAIREFKVQTNLYSADLGRNSGAVVDVVTKSGTNAFHGSAFEFLRNSAMDARNFFNAKNTPFPSFRYNQFGGSFGGPIIKNKTFFFADYEGFRRNSQILQRLTVPTLKMRQGDFSELSSKIYDPLTTQSNPSFDPSKPVSASNPQFTRTAFPNNQIDPSRFDPLTHALINVYPTPQTPGLINNYTSNMSQKQDWNQGDVRVDHHFSPFDTFFARWGTQKTTTVVPNTFPAVSLPGVSQPVSLGNEDSFAGTSVTTANHAAANYVHVFSPRLLNELRVGFNRFNMDYTQEGATPDANLGDQFGIVNSNSFPQQTGFPIVSPSNYAGIGQSRSLPILRIENTYHVVDNMTYVLGSHTLKFGGDFRRRQLTEYQTNRGNGRFNFTQAFTGLPNAGGGDTMATFLLGYPSLIEQDYTLAWVGLRGVESGLYFADDWRITKKLTLNLGLRWEYFSPFSEVANRIANFNPDTATMMVAGQNGVSSTAGVEKNWTNFAPRFGFAYQAGSHTVLRGGFGLFYNPNGNGGSVLRLQRNLPFGPIYSVVPGDLFVGQKLSDGLPLPPSVDFAAAANPTGGVIGVAGNYKSAYAQQFNLTVEHEIAPIQALVRLGYVGNLGRRLGTTFDLNQPVPGNTPINSRRPFNSVRPDLRGVTYAVSDGLSSYHALQLSVDKRLSQGLSLLLGYTWAHAIDNVGTEFGGGTGTPQDPRDRNADRSSSAFDIRHRFTASYLYQIPGFRNSGWTGLLFGNWQTNGILTLQSGLPFTPGVANATVNTGTGSRPDAIRDGNLSSDERSLQRWFDPTAFTTPGPLMYGNAGRNILVGPGRVNFDASLFKDFPIFEAAKLQFRTEAFNLFNHPQFGQPNATIGNAQAGVINSTVGNPRQLQVALRLSF